ncbi:unnamed protein product [Darwinula stevensoni]|uniref:J domain-containing protein n=1 Tax=Darwinula stevensoni TaxID=69355 RepID=A0A7R8XID8_9CRUS|nr:unnamed protein product [Darwinula stevensoni]CAG0891185.1 unnamed protein product [Darwinula stevensoni]
MAGQKFEYDEKGSTFLYFLLSFLGLCLLPATYYLWPTSSRDEEPERFKKSCSCENCQVKKSRLKRKDPWKKTKDRMQKLLLISGWAFLAFLAYKVSQFDYEYANFDPYEILGVDLGASNREIKRAYHKQSLKFHPDKETGDEKIFMKLTKAYEALTDETAKRNWELYGNPDGPGAMTFGIALPSWIVEKENSIWVLGLYTLVFMFGLPIIVGTWWYRSIQYSSESVLLDTTQLYYYFFHKTPSMNLHRVLMVLAASMEFEPNHNKDIKPRPSDNEEVPGLIKQFTNLGEKNKERPLCFGYSVKARALLHAHLSRLSLPQKTLDIDRAYIVKKCPDLIQEMVVCVSQLMMLAHAGRLPMSRLPSLETIENVMKLSPMIVQGLWNNKSPLLQLPHISDDFKHFVTRKKVIKTIKQFAQLPPAERRSILRSLSPEEYSNVMAVISQMPLIEMDVRSEVLDDEETGKITASAIVTVTVKLTRRSMEDLITESDSNEQSHSAGTAIATKDNGKEDETQSDIEKSKKPAWVKGGGKKKGKNAKKGSKKAGQQQPQSKKKNPPKAAGKGNTSSLQPVGTGDHSSSLQEHKKEESEEESSGSHDTDSGSDDDDDQHGTDTRGTQGSTAEVDDEDEEAEWEKFQNRIAKKQKMKLLEGKTRISHPVHCPFFPEEKQEFWWLYISDRKNRSLITSPYHVTTLMDQEEIPLKFSAPSKPGIYNYNLVLRSDSYLDCDMFHSIKLDVKEAVEIPTEHPQWDLSEEEDEEENEGSAISDYTTDDDIDLSEDSD